MVAGRTSPCSVSEVWHTDSRFSRVNIERISLKEPKDQEDVQLTQRIEPNSTIGSILSVRAFEVKRKSVRSGHIGTEHKRFKIKCAGHHLPGHAAPLQGKKFTGTSKEDETIERQQVKPCALWRARKNLAIVSVFKLHEQ